MWQHGKLSEVSLGSCPRDSLVADENIKKRNKQTNVALVYGFRFLSPMFSSFTLQGTSTIFPVFPIMSVVVLAVIIQQKSPSMVFENHPCVYLLAFGLLSAKITNRLVVSLPALLSFYRPDLTEMLPA